MDYHKERFQDFSLMIYKKEKLCALFPANIEDDKIFSHKGLTFGGLLLPLNISFFDVSSIFENIKNYYKNENISELNITSMPNFYHQFPANEMAFILFQEKAKIYRRDKVFAIDLSNDLQIHKTKIKHFKRGTRLGLEVKEEGLDVFWNNILIPLLANKHNSKPVHSLKEIQDLKNKFSKGIKQFNVYLEDEILAGITIFENDFVVKSQYAATTPNGEMNRALDFLFITLIQHYHDLGKLYFSMGTVADKSELGYKQGLIKQKEELGCSIYLQDYNTLSI